MESRKKRYVILFLVSIFAIYCIFNVFIIMFKGECFNRQEAVKLTVCADYYNSLVAGMDNFGNTIYPPLFFMISGGVCYLIGKLSYEICVLTNFLYLGIFIAAMFFLAKKILGNNKAALFGVYVLFIFAPNIAAASRFYSMEFALAGFVALAMCLLLYSDYFKNKLFSLLFGITFAICMLIKWTTVIYIIPPLIVYVIASFRKDGLESRQKKVILFNLLSSLFYVLIVVLIWVVFFLDVNLFWRLYLTVLTKESGISGFWTYMNVSSGALWCYLITTFFFLHVLYWLIFVKSKHEFKWLLISWFFIPLILLSFGAGRSSSRMVLPVLPALALMSTLGVYSIKGKKSKRRAVTYFIAGGCLIFLINSIFSVHAVGNEDMKKIVIIKDILKTIEVNNSGGEGAKVLFLASEPRNDIGNMESFFNYFFASRYPAISGEIVTDLKDNTKLKNTYERMNGEQYIIIMDSCPLNLRKEAKFFKMKEVKRYFLAMEEFGITKYAYIFLLKTR